jgi:hypothetical protein
MNGVTKRVSLHAAGNTVGRKESEEFTNSRAGLKGKFILDKKCAAP